MVAPRFFYGLQFKLILAFSFVVVVALVLAGSIFVAVSRGEAQDAALDHVVAASPPLYSGFTYRQRQEDSAADLVQYVDAAAKQLDLHILVVDRVTGNIAYDTHSGLTGQEITVPRDEVIPASPLRPYVSWHPHENTPGEEYVMVMALPSITGPGRVGVPSVEEEPYWLILAIQRDTIRSAWQGVLPQLGLAAAIALPIAIVMASVLARYISRPFSSSLQHPSSSRRVTTTCVWRSAAVTKSAGSRSPSRQWRDASARHTARCARSSPTSRTTSKRR